MSHIIVCNDKGGVGKTLVCHLLTLLLLDRGESFKVIECEKTARLKKLFGPLVEFHPIDRHRVADVYENPDVLFSYWDGIAESLTGDTRCVVDMGAGVTFAFSRWAQSTGRELLNQGENLTFAVVLTIENEALTSGANNIRTLSRLLPRARFVVINNEKDGVFRTRHGEQSQFVRLPACRVPAWDYLQNAGRFDEVAAKSGQEIAAEYGMELGPAARSMHAFTDWLLTATNNLETLVRPRTAAPRYRKAG